MCIYYTHVWCKLCEKEYEAGRWPFLMIPIHCEMVNASLEHYHSQIFRLPEQYPPQLPVSCFPLWRGKVVAPWPDPCPECKHQVLKQKRPARSRGTSRQVVWKGRGDGQRRFSSKSDSIPTHETDSGPSSLRHEVRTISSRDDGGVQVFTPQSSANELTFDGSQRTSTDSPVIVDGSDVQSPFVRLPETTSSTPSCTLVGSPRLLSEVRSMSCQSFPKN